MEDMGEEDPGDLSPVALDGDHEAGPAGQFHPSGAASHLQRLPTNGPPAGQLTRAPTGTDDPLAVVHRLEAVMAEGIAACKLCGFVHDVGGEILQSVPGRVRMRVGGKGSIYAFPPRSSFSWLGLGRRPVYIHCELFLEHAGEGRESALLITVVFRAATRDQATDIAWRNLCTQIFCDLRGYLMGVTGEQ
jgi:serine/threonine-protein kinase